MSEQNLIFINATKGEKLKTITLPDDLELKIPAGYSLDLQSISIGGNNKDDASVTAKVSLRNKREFFSKFCAWIHHHRAEVFAHLYQLDWTGQAELSRILRAGERYIIKDYMKEIKPMTFDNLNKFSADTRDRLFYQIAEYMCFLHFPPPNKWDFLSTFDGKPESDNHYDHLVRTLPLNLKPDILEILNRERGRPCMHYGDWHSDNLTINMSTGNIVIFDFDMMTVGYRGFDLRMLYKHLEKNLNRADVYASILRHYIDIYNARYRA
jgi:hypothetical protein